MILVNKDNVQLSIEDKELEKYLSMGFVKYEPKKVKVVEPTKETKTKEK